jgi:hypothetical protein
MSAAPTILQVGDRSYKVGPLRYLELGILQRHLDQTSPAPVPQVGNEEGNWVGSLFATLDGVLLFLNVLFSKHQELSDEDMSYLAGEIGPKQMPALFDLAMEEDPRKPSGAAADSSSPKAEAVPSIT